MGKRARLLFLGSGLVLLAMLLAALFHFQEMRIQGIPWQVRLQFRAWSEAVRAQQIESVHLTCSLDPARHALQGTARLQVTHNPPSPDVRLLLNPGLEVLEVTSNGAPAALDRFGEFLIVRHLAPTNEAVIELKYAGMPRAVATGTPYFGADEVVLPQLSMWYPMDLESFHEFEALVETPPEFQIATAGVIESRTVENGMARTRWRAPRPIPGATLAAGDFREHRILYGNIVCHVFAPRAENVNSEWLLSSMGRIHHFYQTRFGSDGYSALVLMVTPAVSTAFHGGDGALLVRPEALADQETGFLLLASLIAQNWWGTAVSAPWFNSRPAGGEVLLQGLALHSAMEAVREVRGRSEYLKMIEKLVCPPPTQTPLAHLDRIQRFRQEEPDLQAVQLLGAHLLNMISDIAGGAAFVSACNTVLEEHRYRAITLHDFRHALELAAERDLQELFRLHFERPARMDYAIAGVRQEDAEVEVRIVSLGDTPLTGTVQIALSGDNRHSFHQIQLGASGGTVRLRATHPVTRAALDPYFRQPDTHRENNVWPRPFWPESIAVGEGGITITGSTTFNGSERLELTRATPLSDHAPAMPPAAYPDLHSSPAFHTSPNPHDPPTTSPRPEPPPRIDAIAWSTGAAQRHFVDATGTLWQLPQDAPDSSPHALAQLRPPPKKAAFAPDGAALAWIDANGRAQHLQLEGQHRKPIEVSGEVLDLAWYKHDTLYLLTAETTDALPMRFHARYSLWHADASSGTAQRLEMNPSEHETLWSAVAER